MADLSQLASNIPAKPRVRLVALTVIALSLCTFAIISEKATLVEAILSGAVALAGLFIFDSISRFRTKLQQKSQILTAQKLMETDTVSAVLTDRSGAIQWVNPKAKDVLSLGASLLEETTIAQALAPHVPNAAALTRRLVERAGTLDDVSENIVGPEACALLRYSPMGAGGLWRMELRPHDKAEHEASVPMISVGRNGAVLFMNDPARTLIGSRVMSLDRLFEETEFESDTVQTVMTENGPKSVFVSMRSAQAGRKHYYLLPNNSGRRDTEISLSQLPVPLLRLSLTGDVLEANAPAKTLLGRQDCAGRPLRESVEGMGANIEEWLSDSRDGGPKHAEFMRAVNSERETFVQVSLQPVGSGDNKSFIAVLTDATELKTLEAQFVQSQKMQAIGQLAGGVAHDFNNLLTAISGHCDLMLLRHDQGEQDYADLMQIHQNANRAAALVGQLLAFSRKQTLQLETLDLRDTLADLAHLLNRLVGEKVTLSLSHDPVLKAIRADKRQLEQVIMNLVVNARDAMPKGGEISIETESLILTAPLKRQRVKVPIGDYVVVRVRDQGCGIDETALEKIFEPFYTTKRTGEGTGLGLSTAYGIVKQTGGFIFADSIVGQGTSFSLLFPSCDHQKSETSAVSTAARSAGLERCEGVVLLVEDEAPVRAFASRALSMRGFQVIEAASAEEALQLLTDRDLTVDVFVTDVVMPGMDGPSWVRKALVDRPDVRIVFVSGYSEGAFSSDQPAIPNSVFLPKPFSLSDLTATVQQQIN